MKNPITDSTLDDRLGFVGTSGSGKTYSAGTGIERLLRNGARCIICDPLDVWWGLRVLDDGKTPSDYDVAILGGAHGDLPINEHAGALIGETVSTSAESFIVSLSTLGTKAAERRFMLALLVSLYRHANGEPVHLIFDEADLWAPQSVRDKEGEAMKLLGMMETVVRRGRIKGFIPWLITQRPAVLSKDVLSQVDGLIAFKLTASQDRDAIGAWIEGQADRQQGKEILASLPTMDRGRGVVWVPSRGILETATFPRKRTFDSSATPKRGEAKRSATLKPLNVEALKGKLATVAKEAEANDPKKLHAELAKRDQELARMKAQASKTAPAPADPSLDPLRIARIEQRGRKEVAKNIAPLRKALEAAMKFIINIPSQEFIGKSGEIDQERLQKAIAATIEQATNHLNARLELQRKAFEKWREEGAKIASELAAILKTSTVSVDVDVTAPIGESKGDYIKIAPPARLEPPRARPRPEVRQANGSDTIRGGERQILIACAQYDQGCTPEQLSVLTGYKKSSRNTYLQRLRAAGLVESRGDRIAATEVGFHTLGSDWERLPTGDALAQYWYSRLPDGECRVLKLLTARGRPEWMDREDLQEPSGYKKSSLNTYLQRLAARQLVESERGQVRASEELFG